MSSLATKALSPTGKRRSVVQRATDDLVTTYLHVSSIRHPRLFHEFLPVGYRATTLSCVTPELVDHVVFAKMHLGLLITLYDDLADRPGVQDPVLLEHLYQLNLGRESPAAEPVESLRPTASQTLQLARYLFTSLVEQISLFPNYGALVDVLAFDIEHFYLANRYAALISRVPEAATLAEVQRLGAHNMGMIAAGVVDLMASDDLDPLELASCREVFTIGQRLGRISNVLFTLRRELAEGDRTNELMIGTTRNPHCQCLTSQRHVASRRIELEREFLAGLDRIAAQQLTSFSTAAYAQGLRQLHTLHARLEGVI